MTQAPAGGLARLMGGVLGIVVLVSSAAGRQAPGTGARDRAGRGAPPNAANGIVGRVTDPAGHPMADVFVSALAPDKDRPVGYRFVSALVHDVTNAAGEYHLTGIPFGQVYVVALPHNSSLTRPQQLSRSGFGKTFYPSATVLAKAGLVSVAPLAPARADIVVQPDTLSAVVGTVIGANGRPVTGGVLHVAHGDGLFGLDSGISQIRSDGSFAASAPPSGTYYLRFRESSWPPPRGVEPKISGAKVVVGNADRLHRRSGHLRSGN